MTKEIFLKLMSRIKEAFDWHEKLEEVLGDSCFFTPDTYLIDAVIEAISEAFGDETDWTGYFVFELDFGRRYKEGCVEAADGTPIPLETAEDLYNLLKKIKEEI